MFENIYLLLGAPEGGSGGSGGIATLVPFALIFLVMYLLIIRPQSKKQKALKLMLANVKKGDKVVTIGGIHGVVSHVNLSTVIVKVGDNATLEFNKESISSVVNEQSVAVVAKSGNSTQVDKAEDNEDGGIQEKKSSNTKSGVKKGTTSKKTTTAKTTKKSSTKK